jgi:hypothetical protein
VGFLDAVSAGEFNFIIFHLLGPSIASLDEIAEIAPLVRDAHYFLVRNFINDSTFFDWDPETLRAYFGSARSNGEIVIPKLNAMACEQVELAGTSFGDFVANLAQDGKPANHSFVLRGYVRTWQGQVAEEFEKINLQDLIASRAG